MEAAWPCSCRRLCLRPQGWDPSPWGAGGNGEGAQAGRELVTPHHPNANERNSNPAAPFPGSCTLRESLRRGSRSALIVNRKKGREY